MVDEISEAERSSMQAHCNPVTFAELCRREEKPRLTELYPACHMPAPTYFYRNQLPFQFSWWGKAFFTSKNELTPSVIPSINSIACKNVCVIGHDGIVALSESEVVDIHLSFVKAHLPRSFFRRANGRLYLRKAAAPIDIDGEFLLGFTPASENYAHWVTDTLPIWVYFARNLRGQGVRLVVGETQKFQEEALSLLEIGAEDLFRMPCEIIRFETLRVSSPINLWSPSEIVRQAALDVSACVTKRAPEIRTGRRLLLSREDGVKRRLLNEYEVERAISDFGFETIRCSELTFEQQVQTMLEADIIVGGHGAALGNILFCKPETYVLELFPEYCIQPHFRCLASQSGMRYGYVVGTSFERESSRIAMDSWDGAFVISVEDVVCAIRHAGSRNLQI